MKTGFCMLLWTTSVTEAHRPLLERLKATGYDGVEIPVFEGSPDDYATVGRLLDEIGLARTAISVIPTPDKDPLSADAGTRARAVEHLNWLVDCTAALGASCVGGPMHQVLGQFSGEPPTEAEFDRAREVHREVGDHAQTAGVQLALEALNRFEAYFLTTMDGLASYLESLDHPAIKGMYDTFHANIEEVDPVAAFERIQPHCIHVHISENDRGVPGRGHVPFVDTLRVIRQSGYDNWLTIEAFGRSLPELAAATRVWRDLSESPEAVYEEGHACIMNAWKQGA